MVSKKLNITDFLEIDKEMYRSIYHYWAFGCTIDEYFYLGLNTKTAEQIKEYITQHEKIVYVTYLNDYNDSHYLNNKYDAYLLLKDFFKRDVIKICSESDFESFLEFFQEL